MADHAADESELVRRAARSDDPDRYVAALLAPRAHRDDLIALAAFAGAVMKIPYQVTDPQIGEIRLQWWREALASGVDGARLGDPVADAFAAMIRRRGLDQAEIGVLLDQIVARIYGAEIADFAQLEDDIDRTEGVLFRLADRILGAASASDHGPAGAFNNAVQAYGLARAGLMLPFELARGRVSLPPALTGSAEHADWPGAIAALKSRAFAHLRERRSASPAGRRPHLLALLPVALVEPYFRVLSRAGHDPARTIGEILPLTRAWRLGKARVLWRL